MKRFTETHDWITISESEGVVGITTHAQKELGEVVFIQFPSIGQHVKAGDQIVVLESTKAAADVYAPVTGEIVAINSALKQQPDLINHSPESEGWLYRMKIDKIEEIEALLTQESYEKLIEIE
jgi:glycine cleavage system H protein